MSELDSHRTCAILLVVVAHFIASEAARLLGVSPDTLRRWVDQGRLGSRREEGRLVVEGADLAAFAAAQAPVEPAGVVVRASARNRMTGLVTRVVRDGVMAQVEIQAGPHRLVSLISREAADELGLEPGVLAVATVKSTNVGVELPARRERP